MERQTSLHQKRENRGGDLETKQRMETRCNCQPNVFIGAQALRRCSDILWDLHIHHRAGVWFEPDAPLTPRIEDFTTDMNFDAYQWV
jgi:hypothetical protein